MKTNLLFVFLFFAALVSFRSEAPLSERIIGTWLFSGDTKNSSSYTKKDQFSNGSRRGVRFLVDGSVQVYQQDFWCTTGGAHYGVLRGTWSMESDSVVSFNYINNSFKGTEKWQIHELSDKRMKVALLAAELDRNYPE